MVLFVTLVDVVEQHLSAEVTVPEIMIQILIIGIIPFDQIIQLMKNVHTCTCLEPFA